MLLLFVLSAFAMAAQSPEIKNVIEDIDVIVCPVYKMPMYPGGDDSLLVFLKRNVKYPELASDAGTQGTVFVTFVVNEDGSVSNGQILRGLSGPGAKECSNEVLRIVSLLPNFQPGTLNGKPAKVQYNLPIRFGLR